MLGISGVDEQWAISEDSAPLSYEFVSWLDRLIKVLGVKRLRKIIAQLMATSFKAGLWGQYLADTNHECYMFNRNISI
jgi:hypothetical protein